MRAVLEARPRVTCHGWSWHRFYGTGVTGHIYRFDETVAWLATQSCKHTVTQLMRVAGRTVGSIITRVWADVDTGCDRLRGCAGSGSMRSPTRGQKYVMVVVDHDTRRLVWAAPGRNGAPVREFFDLLGPQQCAQITHVSADDADFIVTVVAQTCPGAVRVADPFHVVKWATEVFD